MQGEKEFSIKRWKSGLWRLGARRQSRHTSICNCKYLFFWSFLFFFSGEKYIQQRHNVLHVKSIRRGAYRFQDRVLNPNEKSLQLTGWVLQAFSKPGKYFILLFYFLRWCCTLLMFWLRLYVRVMYAGGQGLLRSRNWWYKKVSFYYFSFFLDVQFRGASARMREAYDVIMKDVAKNYNGDMERFRIIESLYFLFSVTIRRGVCSSCQIIWHPSMYAWFFECH